MTTTSIQEATVTMIQQSALRWRRRRGWRATKRVMAARAMTTIHQPALRRRRRRGLAGDEECESGNSDGNDEKGGGRATATATDGEGGESDGDGKEDGEGGKGDGDGNKEGKGEEEGEEEGEGICSVFGAPKIICVEPTQKKRSHIRAVTNHKFANATHKRK